MPVVKFEVSLKGAKHGDKVFVVGDPQEIGEWQMLGAKELHTGPGLFPLWSVEVEIAVEMFQYKYMWIHSTGGAEWESIPNRIYSRVERSHCEDSEFNDNCKSVQPPGSYVSFHGYYAHADWAQQQFANVYADFAKLRNIALAQAEDLAHQRESVNDVQQQFDLAQADLTELWNTVSRRAEDLAHLRQYLEGVEQKFALTKADLAEMRKTVSKQAEDLVHQREYAEGVEQKFALTKADLAEMRKTVGKQAEDLVHQREYVEGVEEKFALTTADLAEMRSTVGKQAQDLVRHRGFIREQDAILLQQREVIQGQQDLLQNLQAELEQQKRSTEKLQRELRDFRAIAPKAEELKKEVMEQVQEDIQKMLGSWHDAEGTSLDVASEEETGPLSPAEGFQSGHEQNEPPASPTKTQADVNADVRFVRQPVESTKEENASTVKPKLWADSVSSEHPPHPEGEAKRLTKEVQQTLLSRWTSSQEEKRKLLKIVQTRLHPDKPGGSTDAMNWFQAWKEVHEAWFLKGPQTNLLDSRQQPAG